MIKINIAEWLGKKKMKQSDLAKATGIRPATISAYYHETVKRIEVEHMEQFCEVFDCQPGDLFEYRRGQKERAPQ